MYVFIYVAVCVLECLYVLHTHTRAYIGSPGSGVIHSCAPLGGCRELKLGPL